MRRRMTVHTFLMGVLLSVMVAYSGVMCLVEAFGIQCPPLSLLAVAGLAGMSAVCAMIPRRAWPFALGAALCFAAVLLWFRQPLQQSFQYVLYCVTEEYALCFDSVAVQGQPAGNALWFLGAVCVPLAWAAAWVICREGSVVLVALVCAPVLLLCLIIVDVAPVLWLVLLTASLLMLLMSQSVRDRNTAEGNRLTWWLVLPTVILVAGITVLWPPADYAPSGFSLQLQALPETEVTIQTIQEQIIPNLPRWNNSLNKEDLRQAGPRILTGLPALEYQAGANISYLRGVSLGVYADSTWMALPQEDYEAQGFDGFPLLSGSSETGFSLQIRTESREPMLYTAYYPKGLPGVAAAVDDAYISNPERWMQYSMSCVVEPGARLPDGYEAFVYERYTQVPEELKAELSGIAAAAGLVSGDVQAVADYVRSSAEYDLNTPPVPDGEDFVVYFLRESQQGYCVHFASACAMLLRTLEVPARYVTGYAVSGQPGQWNTVTEDDAHAWVEYYMPGVGWQYLDPTPVGARLAQLETMQQEDLPDQTSEQDEEAVQPENTTNVPDQETEPDTAGVEADESSKEIPEKVSADWLWLLLLLLALGVVTLRRWLLLRRRRDRCLRGNPNRRALTIWSWLLRALRPVERVPEETLLTLAEKARFSQHTLTEDELVLLQKALDKSLEQLRELPLHKRLWYRLVSVLY